MAVLLQYLQNWLPFLITVIIFSAVLGLARYFLFTHNSLGNEQLFPRQAAMLVFIVVSMIAVVISLPIPENTKNQILSLLGLILSGLLAYSSTTVVANLVAGGMMRFTQPFHTGDFIRADDYFGRVTERGLFDCEIQTIERELVSIPNSWLIARPVEVVRSSGTIVSSTLSLGYDVHHETIRPLLRKAATESGLEEPYVHITELGNFAVTYKVNGLLSDVKNLLTTRSNLNSHILDCLHEQGIEIMSPSFMSQRPLTPDTKVIARQQKKSQSEERTVAESIVFDKAEEAEKFEKQQHTLIAQRTELQQKLTEADKENKLVIQQALDEINVELESMSKPVNGEDKTQTKA